MSTDATSGGGGEVPGRQMTETGVYAVYVEDDAYAQMLPCW